MKDTCVRALVAEPGPEVKVRVAQVMVASSGPWLPLPRGTDCQQGRQRIGTRSVSFLRAHREALGTGREVRRLPVSTL